MIIRTSDPLPLADDLQHSAYPSASTATTLTLRQKTPCNRQKNGGPPVPLPVPPPFAPSQAWLALHWIDSDKDNLIIQIDAVGEAQAFSPAMVMFLHNYDATTWPPPSAFFGPLTVPLKGFETQWNMTEIFNHGTDLRIGDALWIYAYLVNEVGQNCTTEPLSTTVQ